MKQADKTTPNKAESCTATNTCADTDTTRSDASPEERHDMIVTAAYYRAECRGFAEGCELEDWLAAEAEIDQFMRQD